jgi:ABC-2 type transport system permease protein
MTEKKYSQVQAMLAITKGALKAIFRSPSAVVFSLAFPLIFILVFGFIGSGGGIPVYKIVIDKNSDTNNIFFDSIRSSKRFRIVQFDNDAELQKNVQKGRIAGILVIRKNSDSIPVYTYTLQSSTASNDKWPQVLPVLQSINTKISDRQYKGRPNYAELRWDYMRDVNQVREFKTIDFILPGQLGFSLLSAGVFGVAFLFFNLRQTLVLKRFYATPIKRAYIVLGEALARVIFQLTTAIVIIGMGYFFFGFTLVNGIFTFLEIMVLSFLALLVFMGFGFIVSSVAKNESSIPPFANLITLPQFLLAGTFFSVENFPSWLQPICRVLPLTHFNDAMRKIAFEGAHLTDCGLQLAVIAAWGVAAYTVAIKVFKWE